MLWLGGFGLGRHNKQMVKSPGVLQTLQFGSFVGCSNGTTISSTSCQVWYKCRPQTHQWFCSNVSG